MRVLVGCERFGRIRDAFVKAGHDAWSNDLEDVEPEGEYPNYHYYGDVRDIARAYGPWDLMILHPDCTFLTSSAEWAYGDGPYHQKVKPETLVGAARREARANAVAFVKECWALPAKRKALENPRGHLSTAWMKWSQIVQPHQFGDDASKATCLWLDNLPLLKPTKNVAPRIVNGRPRWANQTDSGQNRLSPGEGRAMERAATYPGLADAMVQQWGCL